MISKDLTLLPDDTHRLSNFCGQLDIHLRQIETRLQVEIANRGNQFKVTGPEPCVNAACVLMQQLFETTAHEQLTAEAIHLAMQSASIEQLLDTTPELDSQPPVSIKTRLG